MLALRGEPKQHRQDAAQFQRSLASELADIAAWLLSPPPRHQPAHQHSQQQPDRTGDDEMAEREFLPAFAAPAIPFSGGDECLDGFDAGAVVHGGSLQEIALKIHSLTRYRSSN